MFAKQTKKTQKRSMPFGRFMAATAMLALSGTPGCALDDDFSAVDSEMEFDAEKLLDGVKGHSDPAILMLGAAEDGHLDRIADSFRVIDSADLGLAKNSMSAANARQLMPQLNGIGLSLSQASDDDLATWKPLTDAALDAGVPMIIDDIKDPSRLARVVGVGIEADLVMVTSLGPNRHRVQVYGENSVVNEYVASSDEPGILSSSFAGDIDRAVDEITATLDSYEPSLSTKAANSEGRKFYQVRDTVYHWDLTSSQTATLGLGFEIELVRDEHRSKKQVFVRSMGPGNNPGMLTSNSNTDRGFYQESQTITIEPGRGSSHNPYLFAHAPESPNSNTTYSSTTGWTVSADSSGPSVGFNSSDIVSTTLPDFSATNNTSGNIASWMFKMTTNWQDMFERPWYKPNCTIKGLPALATSNFKPEIEAVFRVPIDYTATGVYVIRHETLMRKIRRAGVFYACNKKDSVKTMTRAALVYVDYGSV